MKVAWVHSFGSDNSLSGIFMHELLPAVRNTGVQVDMFSTGDLYSAKRIIHNISELRQSTRKYDIVHAQWGSGCAFVTAFLESKKFVTLRGSDWYGVTNGKNIKTRLRGHLASYISRLSLARFSRIIVVSNRMRRDIVSRRNTQSVVVIPDGIDLNRFRSIDKMKARTLLGFENDKRPWVLFASVQKGNVIKRPEMAQKAFDICRMKVPDAQFKIISGLDRESVALFMNAGDVLLVTSTHEGWPNVVKEAMACNTPFVSTDVSDLASISAKTKWCRIEIASPEALGLALAQVLQRKEEENLRQHITWMSHDRIADELVQEYKRVLRQN